MATGSSPLRSSWAFKAARMDDSSNLIKPQIRYGDKDTTESTMFNTWFFGATTPPSGTGQLKAYIGGTWVAKPVKVWNGASWVTKPAKHWNGSSWVTTNY